jgi:hypothetical protein
MEEGEKERLNEREKDDGELMKVRKERGKKKKKKKKKKKRIW